MKISSSMVLIETDSLITFSNMVLIFDLPLYPVYDFGIQQMPIIVSATIEASLAILLIIAKIRYG